MSKNIKFGTSGEHLQVVWLSCSFHSTSGSTQSSKVKEISGPYFTCAWPQLLLWLVRLISISISIKKGILLSATCFESVPSADVYSVVCLWEWNRLEMFLCHFCQAKVMWKLTSQLTISWNASIIELSPWNAKTLYVVLSQRLCVLILNSILSLFYCMLFFFSFFI